MATYDLGDGVNLEHLVYDRDDALTAATVAITVTRPDGTSFTAPAITTPSTGTYRAATFVPDAAGVWSYQWSISGTVTDIAPGAFSVRAVAVRDYCTAAELRDHFGDASSLLPEALLQRAISATSRAIDRHTGRRFWQDTAVQAKVYRPDDAYEAEVDDISTTTGLVVETDTTGDATWATTWASTDYQLEPLNASTESVAHAWWRIVAIDRYLFPVVARRTTLRVTARFGWSAIPDEVTEACLIRAAALFKRKEAVFGVAGFNGFGEVRIGRNDHDVVSLLHPYVKIRVGAV
jgi:hypothetical protein